MLKRKLPLLFTSMVICLVLILTSCTGGQLSTSVTPSGGGTISPASGTFQGKVTLVATPAQYYEFSGWAGAASGTTNPLTLTMNSDKQIVAQFTKIRYTIQVTSNIPNGGTISPSSGTYDAGTSIIINATPANGYQFLKWGGDATGNTNPLNTLINANKVITANFIKQYTLSVSADPNAGTVSQNGGIFDADTTINLTATPVFPYAFENWVGADNNNINPTTVTMNTDKSVTVIFEQLVKGESTRFTGILAGFDPAVGPPHSATASTTIDLKQYEWVQGEMTLGSNPPVSATIQDPNGNVIQEFGPSTQGSFSFAAASAGPYTITFTNHNMFYSSYDLTYNIYHLP